MNREVIQQWVTALESGEYRQTTGTLRNIAEDGTPQYCCLGVLCDLAVKANVITEPDHSVYRSYYGEGNESSSSDLPLSVRNWAGLEYQDPFVDAEVPTSDDGTIPRHLPASELNDAYGYDFKQIATAIRETYLTEDEN